MSLIAALGAHNRGIGRDGQLLWRIPDDMKHFREVTRGHPVIMGRKTWESIPEKFRPLPDRTNIVVSRQKGYEAAGAVVADSLDAACSAAEHAAGSSEIFIIGGGELYTTALPRASRLYLTLIDASAPADTYFPEYVNDFTHTVSDESRNHNDLAYRFLTLER